MLLDSLRFRASRRTSQLKLFDGCVEKLPSRWGATRRPDGQKSTDTHSRNNSIYGYHLPLQFHTIGELLLYLIAKTESPNTPRKSITFPRSLFYLDMLPIFPYMGKKFPL